MQVNQKSVALGGCGFRGRLIICWTRRSFARLAGAAAISLSVEMPGS